MILEDMADETGSKMPKLFLFQSSDPCLVAIFLEDSFVEGWGVRHHNPARSDLF